MSETRTYIVPEQPQQNPNDNLAMMAMLNGNGGLAGFNGADITVAQISGTGIYLCWFESQTNTLQLLTGIA